MRYLIFIFLFQLNFFISATSQYTYPFKNPELDTEERIDNLLSLLTIEEKLLWMDQHQPAIDRLDIPYFTTWTEGLHGLAWAEIGTVTATQFPQSKGLGNTWSPDIMEIAGYVEGYEARVYYEKHNGDGIGLVIRAPVVDMGRDPRWGRTEENLGEDPYLVSVMGKGMVAGLQGDDPNYLMTATTLKHFLANNNEVNRAVTSSNFDERNLREFYIVPFRESLVYGNARSFMTGYNLINNIPAIVSPLIEDIVFNEYGFDGMICTDAFAYYNLFGSQNYYPNGVKASAEIVLSGTSVFVDHDQETLDQAYHNGLITEGDIDRVLRGNVRLRFQLGLFDPPSMVPYDSISASDDPWFSEMHEQKALTVAEKSIVLLKNDNEFLPLRTDSIQSIALIGPNANDVYRDWYGGNPPYKVSILQGLQNRLADSVQIAFFSDNTDNQAVQAADTTDMVIMCLGNHPTCGNYDWAVCESDYEGRETKDRKYIELEPSQVELTKQVFEANKNMAVVMVSSYPQAIPWIQDSVPSIIHITHSGQEQGNAVARALFGDINPGGKTVFTWLNATNELPDMLDYNIRNNRTYMYYDGEPLYPFGHGLSYTNFQMDDLILSSEPLTKDDTLNFQVSVENVGDIAGDEVVQVYVRFLNSDIVRPNKELKAFKRVTLSNDSSMTLNFKLPVNQLYYWNETEQSFVVEEADVEIQIGNSSVNIMQRDTITITEGGKVRLVPEVEPDEPTFITENPRPLNARITYLHGNPHLEIVLDRNNEFEIAIYDVKGRLVTRKAQNTFSAGRNVIPLHEQISSPGIYIIKGKTGKQSIHNKFMIH